MTRYAIVGCGIIEHRVVQAVMPPAPIKGSGQEEVERSQPASVGDAARLCIVRSGSGSELDSCQIAIAFGEDIDHPEKSVAPVQRGHWAANDLDSLNQGDVD